MNGATYYCEKEINTGDLIIQEEPFAYCYCQITILHTAIIVIKIG